ncbi:MAG: Ldh family oxidoreductase [Planctomycetes bacterium]|nr:Ldh family oxidoreductase [Planctomycetota bacterium]
MIAVSHQKLTQKAIQKLENEGVASARARIVVDHMLTATLWGRSTHGFSVRFPYILKQAQEGAGEKQLEIVESSPIRVVVDANEGFGYLAGYRCTEILRDRVSKNGSATIALRNTRHTGMIGYYTNILARAGTVAMAFGNCVPLMAPYGGKEALLGTNPISFAFPAEPDPILVDMATSALSYGDVTERDQAGETLPEGCALGPEGEPTADAAEAREGALLPFGGHRGGALAVAVQLLAGVFTGAAPIPDEGKDYGLLMIGYRRGLLAGEQNYDHAVQEFIQRYLSVPERPGMEVRLPGSQRYENLRQREKQPIEISEELARELGLNAQ